MQASQTSASQQALFALSSTLYQHVVSARWNQNMIELIILASKIQKHGTEYPELLLFSLGHSQFLQMIHVSYPLKAREQQPTFFFKE